MRASETSPGTGQSADAQLRDGLTITPASCAEFRTVLANFADGAGASVTYHGRVLQWDIAKSRTIELGFQAPWYSQRTISLFLWSEKGATLQLYPEGSVRATDISLKASGETGAHPQSVSVDVPLSLKSSAGSVRVTLLDTAATSPGVVCFGIEEGPSGECTAAGGKTAFNERTRFLAYTWITVVCALFALFAPLGSYGFILVGLPALPALLRYVGLDSASKIDISALSLWLYMRSRDMSAGGWRLLARILPVLCAATSFAAAYVLIGLITPLKYGNDLEDALNSPLESMQDVKLFCDYPERLETRALLARRFALIRSESDAWGSAIKTIRTRLDTDGFLGCLGKFRFARVFSEAPEVHDDEARAFYAALIFYSINTFDEIPAAMKEIQRILYPEGLAAGHLSELAWRTFTARMEKNIGEKVTCKDDVESSGCVESKAKCKAAHGRLESYLGQSDFWSYLDRRQNAIYIEARDVAASSRLSAVCSAIAVEDVRQAINHYEAMLGAIPGEPRLDRPLSAINLRSMAESFFYPNSTRPIVQSWAKECAGRLKQPCAEIREAVIGGGDRKFFLKDRIASNSEWDKASLAQANFRDLREFVLSESKRNWRKPWASRSG